MELTKVDMLSYRETVWRAADNTQWVCVNGNNAGRIAEKRKEPLADLYWLDSNDFVKATENNLFVFKRD